MGNGMPFVLEKGPVWEYFDRAYSPGGARGGIEGRLELLNEFRTRLAASAEKPQETWSQIFERATTTGANPTIKAQLRKHIVDDWFTGLGTAGGGGWLNWDTNPAEVIVRGLARACEVSLGIANHRELPGLGDESVPAARTGEVTRLLPIEFFWACPLPVFQCWIAWRHVRTEDGPGDGLVTFVWATPAPAWSYLAKRPADDGPWLDEADRMNFGPLGRVDSADGARRELYHRNLTSGGLLLVGDDDTEVLPKGVDLSANSGLSDGPAVDVNQPSVTTPDELAELATERATGRQNRFVFDLPVLKGSGEVVTVSPFDDVGGYFEPRDPSSSNQKGRDQS